MNEDEAEYLESLRDMAAVEAMPVFLANASSLDNDGLAKCAQRAYAAADALLAARSKPTSTAQVVPDAAIQYPPLELGGES